MNWAEGRRVRLRNLFARRDLTGRPDLPMLSVYRDYGVVPREGRDDNYNKPGEDLGAYRVVRRGDLVLNKMKTWQGSLGISRYDGIVSPAYFVARPLTDDHPEFLHHLLRSGLLIAEYAGRSKGIRPSQWDLPWDEFQNISVDLPPIEIQRSIADYLDRETARIDALIVAKQRMVELLEERWTNIRYYLTRGENSSRWNRVQLRRIARLQAGAAFPHAYQGDAVGSISYVKVGDLSNVDEHDHLRAASNRVTPEVAAALRSSVLPSGTIVLPKIGAALLTNKRAILAEPSCLDQNVMGVMVKTGNPRFVYHCLASIDLGELSTPGPVPLLNEEAALSVRLPWPSRKEQDKIVAALDSHRESIRPPVTILARQVALLNERRQALITAAVTGRITV